MIYMQARVVKIVRIGNYHVVCLPAGLLRKYKFGDSVILEQRLDEIAFRPKRQKKLSWRETYKQMATAKEDWSDFDRVFSDGLD